MENEFLLFLVPAAYAEIVYQMSQTHMLRMCTKYAVSHNDPKQLAGRSSLEDRAQNRSSIVERVQNSTINKVSIYCGKFIQKSDGSVKFGKCIRPIVIWDITMSPYQYDANIISLSEFI